LVQRQHKISCSQTYPRLPLYLACNGRRSSPLEIPPAEPYLSLSFCSTAIPGCVLCRLPSLSGTAIPGCALFSPLLFNIFLAHPNETTPAKSTQIPQPPPESPRTEKDSYFPAIIRRSRPFLCATRSNPGAFCTYAQNQCGLAPGRANHPAANFSSRSSVSGYRRTSKTSAAA
jgi:hypothetical protein